MKRLLFALTVQEPWAWAILHAGKGVENRSWKMPARLVGEQVALHTSRKYDSEGADWIRETFRLQVPTAAELSLGAITGLVRFDASFEPMDATDLWTVGPWCFPVLDREALTFAVPCRGALGFWPVPGDVADEVMAGLVRP